MELDLLVVNVDTLDFLGEMSGRNYEVDADGRYVVVSVRVIGEAQEERRLSDARATDEEQLEEVVAMMGSAIDQYYSELIIFFIRDI